MAPLGRGVAAVLAGLGLLAGLLASQGILLDNPEPAEAQRPARLLLPLDAGTGNVSAPAANTAAAVTCAAVSGRRQHLALVAWSYSAAPTGGRLTLADGADTVLDLAITAAGPGNLFGSSLALRGEVGNALVATLAAGGAGVSGKLNTYCYVE